MVPGRKFSSTMSALSARRRAACAPAALRRSSPMLFLLRLNMGKKPAPAPSRWRVRSPSTGSILITSAPRSASTSPQVGPMTIWVNSTTRSPVSGRRRLVGAAAWPAASWEGGGAKDDMRILLVMLTGRDRAGGGRLRQAGLPQGAVQRRLRQPSGDPPTQGKHGIDVAAGVDAHAF